MSSSLSLLIYVFINFCFFGAQSVDITTIWERGKQAQENGQFEKALQIWGTAIDQTKEQSSKLADPRIGFDYIQLATHHNLSSHYRKAVNIYYWSFKNGCTQKYRNYFSTELERIAPIIENQMVEKWENYLKNDIISFCQNVISFWNSLDPTYSDNYNERLLEHWKRIAYARKHFTRNKITIYDTDDRGLIYVRLGEPDAKKNGTMQFNYGLVRSWIQDIMDTQSKSGTTLGSFGGDSAGSSSSIFVEGSNEFLEVEKISKEALLSLRYPYYEIWVYRDLNESKHDNLVYIFGQDGDDGSFGLRSSLDEMIPNSAFRSGSNKGLVTPGLILQLLFYEQTSQIDTYFEKAFYNLETRILTRNGLNRKTSDIVEEQNRYQLARKQFNAPQQETSLLENISTIDIESYQYRFLDQNNKPYLATFVKSQPQKSIYLDQVKNHNYSGSNYELIHHILSVSNEKFIIDKQKKKSSFSLEEQGSVNNMRRSRAYFKSPNLEKGIEQHITVELHDQNKDSLTVTDKLISENIVAIGKTSMIQPTPLSTDTNELVLSDILLGKKEISSDSAAFGPADFTVIHNNKISTDSDLLIHFQVYHLSPKIHNTRKFTVEYKVSKHKKGLFKRLFSNKNEVGLTLNFETLDTYYINNIEIDTAPFDPGTYELSLKVKEPTSNRETSRKILFEIVKYDE